MHLIESHRPYTRSTSAGRSPRFSRTRHNGTGVNQMAGMKYSGSKRVETGYHEVRRRSSAAPTCRHPLSVPSFPGRTAMADPPMQSTSIRPHHNGTTVRSTTGRSTPRPVRRAASRSSRCGRSGPRDTTRSPAGAASPPTRSSTSRARVSCDGGRRRRRALPVVSAVRPAGHGRHHHGPAHALRAAVWLSTFPI